MKEFCARILVLFSLAFCGCSNSEEVNTRNGRVKAAEQPDSTPSVDGGVKESVLIRPGRSPLPKITNAPVIKKSRKSNNKMNRLGFGGLRPVKLSSTTNLELTTPIQPSNDSQNK